MKTLNKSIILKEKKYSARIFNCSLFFIVGAVISISPYLYLKTIDLNTIIGICFCLVCFGLPFGYFFGLRRLIPTLKEKKALTSGNFEITIDKVKSTRMLQHGVKSEIGDYYCQVEFEKYSKITGEYYTISRRLFDNTNDGDSFYLIYSKDISKIICIYPEKNFELDTELKQHLID